MQFTLANNSLLGAILIPVNNVICPSIASALVAACLVLSSSQTGVCILCYMYICLYMCSVCLYALFVLYLKHTE